MEKDEEPDKKVTLLFPSGAPRSGAGPDSLLSQPDALTHALDALLSKAESVDCDPLPRQPRVEPPDSRHRNARQCPQCDQHTWRGTRACIYCELDLFEYDAMRAEKARMAAITERKRRLALIAYCCVGGFVLFGLLMERAPEWARGPAAIITLVLMCLSALFLKAASG
jgi:hypothetical protein